LDVVHVLFTTAVNKQLIFFQEDLQGIKLGHAVVVLKAYKETTTVVDELKCTYDLSERIACLKSFPIKSVYQHLVFSSSLDHEDNFFYQLTADNNKCVHLSGKCNYFYYSKRNQPSKCRECGKPGKQRKVLSLPAERPIIIIHVKNNSRIKTLLKYELAECLNVLVTLKDNITLQQTPIRQVIITKTIERDVMSSKTKIVVDGQTLYDGLSKFEFFDFVEHPLCLQCDPFEFNHSEPDMFD
jgi:hypothetical protein